MDGPQEADRHELAAALLILGENQSGASVVVTRFGPDQPRIEALEVTADGVFLRRADGTRLKTEFTQEDAVTAAAQDKLVACELDAHSDEATEYLIETVNTLSPGPGAF